MNDYPVSPDEKRIEELLGKVQPVPSEGFHQKMARAAWRERSAVQIRWKVAAALLTVAALMVLLTSPQGRAWAQEVFQFFTKIQSKTVELPESMQDMKPPEPYNVPLVPVYIPTVSAEMAALPGCETAQKAQSYRCQVDLVEEKLGFDLKELPKKLDNSNFESVQFNLASKQATIVYSFDSSYRNFGNLYLTQGLGNTPVFGDKSPWEAVPADQVQTVEVGGYQGEYVEGSFTMPVGSSELSWSTSERRRRLAWSDGERWYHLDLWPNLNTADRIRRDELIELAESLVDVPLEKNEAPDLNFLPSISAAEQVSGWDLKAPTLLPIDMDFSYARFNGFRVQLAYGINEELLIYEWEGESLDFDALSKTSYSNYRILEVNGKKAFFGSVEGGDPHLFLWWEHDGLSYQMYYYKYFAWIDMNKMVKIAESMQDIDDFRTKDHRPYEHVSMYEQALEMDIREFSATPAGWSFAGLWTDPSSPCIVLFYKSISGSGWFYVDQCRTDAHWRLSDIPWNRIQRVKVGNTNAQYVVGDHVTNPEGKLIWDPDIPAKQLYWKQDGLWMQMRLGGESTFQYEREDLITYAESLR